MEAVGSPVAQGRDRKSACRAAGVSRAAYYRARKASPKSGSDAELVGSMCRIENDRHVSQAYGVDGLTAGINRQLRIVDRAASAKILGRSGRASRKRTHGLMKPHGVRSRLRRRRRPDDYYRSADEMLGANRAPNVLHGEFKSARPMRKMAAGVACVPCGDAGFLCLSALLDLFDKEAVSHAMSSVNSVEFAVRTVRRLPPGSLKDALLHSDRGGLCRSNAWAGPCDELDIVRGMSRRGNCRGNPPCEGFFFRMKSDLGLYTGRLSQAAWIAGCNAKSNRLHSPAPDAARRRLGPSGRLLRRPASPPRIWSRRIPNPCLIPDVHAAMPPFPEQETRVSLSGHGE